MWKLYVIPGIWFLQLDIENSSSQKVWQEVEFVFGKHILVNFVSTMLCKQ